MPMEDKRDSFMRYVTAVEGGSTKLQAIAYSGRQWSTLQRWVADDSHIITDETGRTETFASRLARARLISAEGYADKAQVEVEQADSDNWQVAKLRSDYYKWRAAMANPKEYGDRKQVDTSITVRMLPPEERDRALARLTAKATLANPLTVAQLATVEDANVQDLDTPL